MPVAKGRSSTSTELDILRETLENMIKSTETKFGEIIDSLKAMIFDIEHNHTLTAEEQKSQSTPFFEELEQYTTQLYHSRNKLVICIYSMCESILCDICEEMKIASGKAAEGQMHMCEPTSSENQVDNKRRKNKNCYLADYLRSLNPLYKKEWKNANIVDSSIKQFRNYLTHGECDSHRADKIICKLNSCGINSITQEFGHIIIQRSDVLYQILDFCSNMLVEADQIAKSKHNSHR